MPRPDHSTPPREIDAVGRADITLPDAAIRPLWMGMRFWGPAVTMRVVPANQRMPPVSREDALRQHGLWFGARAERLGSFGEGLRLQDAIRPEVAEDVLYFAARIAIDDKQARRRLYDKLGKDPDETVDQEAAAYFKDRALTLCELSIRRLEDARMTRRTLDASGVKVLDPA